MRSEESKAFDKLVGHLGILNATDWLGYRVQFMRYRWTHACCLFPVITLEVHRHIGGTFRTLSHPTAQIAFTARFRKLLNCPMCPVNDVAAVSADVAAVDDVAVAVVPCGDDDNDVGTSRVNAWYY